jgi:predicted nucleic acid-binding protein
MLLIMISAQAVHPEDLLHNQLGLAQPNAMMHSASAFDCLVLTTALSAKTYVLESSAMAFIRIMCVIQCMFLAEA